MRFGALQVSSLALGVCCGHAQDFSWIFQTGTSGNDQSNCVWSDADGNIYVAGESYGSLHGNSNAGQYDIFIMQLDRQGSHQWTFQKGDSASEFVNSCYVDASGSMFLTGHTYSGLDGNSNVGSADIYAMKINGAVSWQWTFQIGSSSNDVARAVQVDASGNVILAGETMGGLDGFSNAGGWDMFVINLDTSGVLQWTYQTGTSSNDEVGGLQIDAAGDIFIAGDTQGGFSGLTNAGLYDMFIMKLDSAGTPQWTVQTGGSGSEVVHAFHIDASGNMFLAGYTDGQLHGNSHSGGRDIFAMKLNAAVSWQWTFQTGSASHDVVRAMQIDALGNVVLAGETYGGLQGSNAGFSTRDIFAMELDSAGSHLWTFQSGSSSDDEARGLRIEGTDILLAGRTKGSLGGANSGSYDIFVMGPARPTTSTRSSTTTTTSSTSRTSTRTTITWTSTSSTTSRSSTFTETQITSTTSITITTTGTTSSSRTTDTATESTSSTSGTATFTTSATSQTGSSTESHTASTTTSASMTSSGVSTTSSTSMGSSFTTTSQSITATSSQTTAGFVSTTSRLATGNTWIRTTTHTAMVPPSVTMTTTFETATSSATSQATLTSTATTSSVSSTVILTWSSAEGLEAGALVASILILLAFCLGTCTACLRLKAKGQKGETKRNEKDEAGLPLEELRISTETWQDRTIEAQQGELSRGIEVDLASAKTPLESTDENAEGGSIEKVQQVEEMGRIDPNQEAAQKAGASSPHVSKAVEVSHSVMKPEENQADSQALTNVYIGRPEGANNPSPKKGSRFRSH